MAAKVSASYWVRWLVERVERRLPEGLSQGSAEERRRAQMVLVVRDILLVTASVALLVRTVAGLSIPYFPIVTIAAMILVQVVLRRTSSVSLAAHLLVGSFVVILGVVNLLTGGILPGPQTAAAIFPLLAVLLLGAKPAIIWSVVGLLHLSAGAYLVSSGSTPLLGLSSAQAGASINIAPMLLIPFVHAVAAWYDWLKQSALDALGEARDEVARANAAKSVFLSNLSHELRTPLSGVLGALEVVGRSELDTDQGKFIKIGRDSAGHMLQLLSDILDVTKLEAGHLVMEEVSFDLSEVARSVFELERLSSRAEGVEFRFHSEFYGHGMIAGDALRTRQIMANLLNNASKFTEAGHVDFSVRTRQAATGRLEVQIRVEDTGIGISEEKVPHLFEAFTQADRSTTRRFGGTGLGLHITHQLVEKMGGRIEVDSELGRGTIFTVEFTVDPGEAPAPQATTDSPASVDLGLRVLVAEDNDINRSIIEAILELIGCDSSWAENGEVAVQAMLNERFDCVLMDCEMPVMDGYEATRRLRAAGVDKPIIALTAHSSGVGRPRCLEAGMTEMLSKPITIELLRTALQRFC